MEDSICVRILVAWHRWPIVAFEGGEVNPACTRTREVVSLSQYKLTRWSIFSAMLSIQPPEEGNSSRGRTLTRSSSGGVGSITVRWRGTKMVQSTC